MTKWINKINLSSMNSIYESDGVVEAAKHFKMKLDYLIEVYTIPHGSTNANSDVDYLIDISDQLDYLVEDGIEDEEALNCILDDLYNLGDESFGIPNEDFFNMSKKIWVQTII